MPGFSVLPIYHVFLCNTLWACEISDKETYNHQKLANAQFQIMCSTEGEFLVPKLELGGT